MRYKYMGLFLWLSLAAPLAFGQISARHWYLTNTLNAGIEQTPLRAFAAEDWTLDQWTRDLTGAVPLPTNTLPVWFISARTNLALVYAIQTGAVVAATSGQVRITIPWGSSILSAGRYVSTVRAYQPINGTNAYIATLAAHYIDVSDTPDAGSYAAIAPVAISALVQSNQLGSGFSWNGSQWEASASIQAGATQALGGVRLSLGYDSARRAITGEVPINAFATGSPVYVESDPTFSAWLGTNTYSKAPELVAGATFPAMNAAALTNWTQASGTGVNAVVVGSSNYAGSVAFYGAVSASATGIVFTATGSGSGATNIIFIDNWVTGAYDSGNATFTVGHPTFAAGSGIDPVIASNSFVLKSGDTITGPMTNTSLYIDYGYGNVGTGSNIYFLGGISNRIERLAQIYPIGSVGTVCSDQNVIRGSNIYSSTIIGSSGCGIYGAGWYRSIISSYNCFDTNNAASGVQLNTFIAGSSGCKMTAVSGYGNAIVGAKDSTISAGSNSGILGGDGSTISVGSSGILGGGGHTIAASACAVVGGGNAYIGSSAQGGSVVLGGNYNRIEGGVYNVIGGGQYNIFSGASYYSSIINGSYNACKTGASFSVVGGYKASANHTRCFVWSDNNRGNSPFNSTNSFFESTSTNQFLVHATGGVGINTNAPLAALHVNGVTRSDAYQFPSGAKLQEISGDTNTLYFVTPDGLTTGRITIAY